MRRSSSRTGISTALLLSGAMMLGCGDDGDNEFGTAIGNAICDTDADGGLWSDGGPAGPITGGLDAGLDASIGAFDAGAVLPVRPTVPQDTFIPLTEGQVVGVALALHAGEVDVAKLAVGRLLDAKVRAFAEEMITAHEAAQQSLVAVGIVPEASDKATELQDGAKASAQVLTNTPDGAALDGAYIKSQVTAHTRARTLFDAVLRKNAVTPLLQMELKAERDEAVGHLVHAQALVDGAPRGPANTPSGTPGTGIPNSGGTSGTGGAGTNGGTSTAGTGASGGTGTTGSTGGTVSTGGTTGTSGPIDTGSGTAGTGGTDVGGTGGINTGGPGFP